MEKEQLIYWLTGLFVLFLIGQAANLYTDYRMKQIWKRYEKEARDGRDV